MHIESDRKEYQSPIIILETELETRAGSPLFMPPEFLPDFE